jgi:hypothetical protein
MPTSSPESEIQGKEQHEGVNVSGRTLERESSRNLSDTGISVFLLKARSARSRTIAKDSGITRKETRDNLKDINTGVTSATDPQGTV